MKYLFHITLFSLLSFSACKLDELPDLPTDFVVDFDILPADGADAQACPFTCTVQFSNTSTPPSLVDFEWDFGFDGPDGTSDEREPEVSFPDVDMTYTITLVGFNDRGEEVGRRTKNVNVIDPTAEPEPDFTVANDGCFAQCSLTFTNTSVNATRFVWDFGDGSPQVETDDFNPIDHLYTRAGEYTVRLYAFNGPENEEKVDSTSEGVTINIHVFEDVDPTGGAAKAITQLDDGSYAVIGNTGISGGDIYLFRSVAGGGSAEADTYTFPATFGNVTVGDAAFLSNSSIAVIGTGSDPASGRTRLVYARLGIDGEEQIAPRIMPEFDAAFNNRDVTVERILPIGSQKLAAIGSSFNVNTGASAAYIKIFDVGLVSEDPGVLITDTAGDLFVQDADFTGSQLVIATEGLSGTSPVGKILVTDLEGEPASGFPKILDADYRNLLGILSAPDGNLYISVFKQNSTSALIQLSSTGDATANWESPLFSGSGVNRVLWDAMRSQLLVIGGESQDAAYTMLATNGTEVVPVQRFAFNDFNSFYHATTTIDRGLILGGSTGNDGTRYLVKTAELD